MKTLPCAALLIAALPVCRDCGRDTELIHRICGDCFTDRNLMTLEITDQLTALEGQPNAAPQIRALGALTLRLHSTRGRVMWRDPVKSGRV